jgi:hypothetical protein
MISGIRFDRDDGRAVRSQARSGIGGDFHNGSAGHAVEHDGQFGAFRDGFEMEVKAFLRRLVVVRADLQRAGRTEFFRRFRQLDGFGGRIRAGARNDLAAARGEFDRQPDDLDVFVRVESGRFAGGPDRDNAVDARRDLPIDQRFEGRDIDFAVTKRGDKGGVQT